MRLLLTLVLLISCQSLVASDLENLKASAKLGFPKPQYNLALKYQLGKDVAKDYAEAAKWYERAAKQGIVQAQHNLGILYSNGGHGIEKDLQKAREYFEQAAAQGFAKSQYNLGRMYQIGNGVAPDHNLAVEYYLKAAEQGIVDAQYNLGAYYQNNAMIYKEYKDKAIYWYTKAAEQGHKKAQNNLRLLNKTQ